jgi:hypothetical protein
MYKGQSEGACRLSLFYPSREHFRPMSETPNSSFSPYQSPRLVDDAVPMYGRDPLPTAAIKRAVLTVIGTAALFGAGGLAIGLGMAVLLPEYYMAVFNLPAGTRPERIAMGLGLTQGIATGIGVGLVIVVVTAWAHRRRNASI